jgi:hypothetical protein
LPDEEVAVLENCATAFEKLGPSETQDRPLTLFILAGECLPGCEYEPKKELQGVTEAMVHLADSCVPKDSENTSWHLATEISAWISERRARAGSAHSELFGRLDRAMTGQEYALELSSSLPGLFDLAQHPGGTGRRSSIYIVATESEITVGASPVAVFSPDKVTLKELPGGEFPGADVALGELSARVASYREELLAKDIGRMDAEEQRAVPLLLVSPTLSARRSREPVKALGAVLLAAANHGLAQGHGPAVIYDSAFTGPEIRFRSDRMSLSRGDATQQVQHADGSVDWSALDVELAKLGPDNVEMLAVVLHSTTTVADLLELRRRAEQATGSGVVLVLRDDAAPEPSVTLGEIVVKSDPNNGKKTGSLDKAIVRRYVERKTPTIHDCYEKALTSQPELVGQLEAEFTIDRKGRVPTSAAKGPFGDVNTCVAAAIKGIHFPRPVGGGGVVVTTSFEFRVD